MREIHRATDIAAALASVLASGRRSAADIAFARDSLDFVLEPEAQGGLIFIHRHLRNRDEV